MNSTFCILTNTFESNYLRVSQDIAKCDSHEDFDWDDMKKNDVEMSVRVTAGIGGGNF